LSEQIPKRFVTGARLVLEDDSTAEEPILVAADSTSTGGKISSSYLSPLSLL
jgi:hypothetical protein